jgi:TPR repeat protein
MAQLGHIYETGGFEDENNGRFYPLVKKNIEEAIILYKSASNSDNELALNFLGAHAFNNEKDMDLAVENFRRAAESERCGRALNNLGMCFEIGIGSAQQDYTKALNLYEKSAKLGYSAAMANSAYLKFKQAEEAEKDSASYEEA